jgi:hypothetical protein
MPAMDADAPQTRHAEHTVAVSGNREDDADVVSSEADDAAQHAASVRAWKAVP